MAASDIAVVVSLLQKAAELDSKCRYERCLEKGRAALAAAEALGAEDCAIVAHTKMEVARSTIQRETARKGRFSQAFVQEVLDLLAANAAALRRRRDAGTLMEGKCRPIEEQWFMEYMGDEWPENGVLSLSGQAALVGYDNFLGTSCCCMYLICAAVDHGSFERGGEAERALFSFACDLIDDAVALMVQPRVEKYGTATELGMLTRWPIVLDSLARSPEHHVWHVRVAVALARLRQSGVVEKRGLEGTVAAEMDASLREDIALLRSLTQERFAAASGQLKSCAMAGCGAREAHVSHFGKCSACKAAVYCCRDHQQADWPAHKAACKAARKAAAAAKDAT
jgi:hypothetical protein